MKVVPFVNLQQVEKASDELTAVQLKHTFFLQDNASCVRSTGNDKRTLLKQVKVAQEEQDKAKAVEEAIKKKKEGMTESEIRKFDEDNKVTREKQFFQSAANHTNCNYFNQVLGMTIKVKLLRDQIKIIKDSLPNNIRNIPKKHQDKYSEDVKNALTEFKKARADFEGRLSRELKDLNKAVDGAETLIIQPFVDAKLKQENIEKYKNSHVKVTALESINATIGKGCNGFNRKGAPDMGYRSPPTPSFEIGDASFSDVVKAMDNMVLGVLNDPEFSRTIKAPRIDWNDILGPDAICPEVGSGAPPCLNWSCSGCNKRAVRVIITIMASHSVSDSIILPLAKRIFSLAPFRDFGFEEWAKHTTRDTLGGLLSHTGMPTLFGYTIHNMIEKITALKEIPKELEDLMVYFHCGLKTAVLCIHQITGRQPIRVPVDTHVNTISLALEWIYFKSRGERFRKFAEDEVCRRLAQWMDPDVYGDLIWQVNDTCGSFMQIYNTKGGIGKLALKKHCTSPLQLAIYNQIHQHHVGKKELSDEKIKEKAAKQRALEQQQKLMAGFVIRK